jgi:prevent-host-death family protein
VRTVNIHEAKTHLSRLLAAVEDGEEVIIARNGRPVARLVGVATATSARRPGVDRGRIRYADDLDAPLPVEIAREFED